MRRAPDQKYVRARSGQGRELRDELLKALDGARRQGGEEEGEHREVERVAHGLPSGDPDLVEIVDELEGEERDAERGDGAHPAEEGPRRIRSRPSRDLDEAVTDQVRVLVGHQRGDADADRERRERPAADPRRSQGGRPAKRRENGDHQHPAHPAEVEVEDEAGREQPPPPDGLRQEQEAGDRGGGEGPEPGLEKEHAMRWPADVRRRGRCLPPRDGRRPARARRRSPRSMPQAAGRPYSSAALSPRMRARSASVRLAVASRSSFTTPGILASGCG